MTSTTESERHAGVPCRRPQVDLALLGSRPAASRGLGRTKATGGTSTREPKGKRHAVDSDDRPQEATRSTRCACSTSCRGPHPTHGARLRVARAVRRDVNQPKEGETARMAIADVSGQSISELVSLQGRTAVVTGAARGIGKAIARRFAEAGANLVLGDMNLELVTRTATEIAEQYPVAVGPQRVDVRDPDEVAALVDVAMAAGDGIDIWVNNAGIYPSTAFLDISHDEWDRVLDTNVRGCSCAARPSGGAWSSGTRRGDRERGIDGRGQDRRRCRALHHVEARRGRADARRGRRARARRASACSRSRRA